MDKSQATESPAHQSGLQIRDDPPTNLNPSRKPVMSGLSLVIKVYVYDPYDPLGLYNYYK